MRQFGRVLGRFLALIFALLALAWITAPKEVVDREIAFEPDAIGADVSAYLAAVEANFADIRPGVEKRVLWAGQVGAKTSFSIVYVHGFSATSEEIRPVPDQVAQAIGANLFFTRLAGHGRTGDAMAEASAGDWIEDLAEAVEIGRRIGDRVIVMATSTGATLAAIGATDPVLSKDVAGYILVSPNFGVANPAAKILDLPWARVWGPIVAGDRRGFATENAEHDKYWTTDYPTLALFPMAALIREAKASDYSLAKVPALFLYSPDDKVVDVSAIPSVRDSWAGGVQEEKRTMGEGDDPNSHVIAGRILSPGQTDEAAGIMVDWIKGL